MSAVFKVRDQNGNLVEIPVLRGEQGPQGKPGDKGEKGDPGDVTSVGAVLYEAQSLTDAQKSQARTNIGAFPTTGGTVTGQLIAELGLLLKKGFELDGSVKTYDFGYNWDDGTGPGFAMRGSSFSGSGDGPGCFVFWARKDKTGQVKLIGSPNGTLSWNGLNVETLFAQTKGTSAPSAWKQHTASGLIQQGGYLAIADVGETITFPTAYKHTPTVIVNYIDPANPAPSWLKSVSAKGFTPATSSTTATGLVWLAVGFG